MKRIAFADIATNSENFALAIAHVEGGQVRIDSLHRHVPPFARERVIEEFCALLRDRGILTVGGHRYSSAWAGMQFRGRGITYQPCDRERPDLYPVFFAMLKAAEVVLPASEELQNQLRSVKRGLGGLDDLASVVAGVCVLAREALPVRETENVA